MALKNIKVPKKKPRAAARRQSGLAEPVWDGAESWDGKKYHTFRRGAMDNYYFNFKPADLMPSVFHWMKENGYSNDDIKCAKASPFMPVQGAIIARCLTRGMPDYHEKHNEYWISLPGTSGVVKPASKSLREYISVAIERGRPIIEAKQAQQEKEQARQAYKPTIQQVMREASVHIASEVDEFVDNFDYSAQQLKTFDPLRLLRKAQCKPNHARIIRKFYEGELSEAQELNTKVGKRDMDEMREQLEEGYAHLDTKQRKNMLEMFNSIVNACDILIAEAKTTRKPRKAKVKSLDQQVAKMKFKVSDSDYGIASEPATKLIGAVMALVFNCKTRKVGLYIATDPDGFGVKGTSLTNYEETTSIQKTLRKPLEVLPQIRKTTKAKTLKMFEGLKTTETKLNGRFNSEIVILNVFK